MTWRHILAGVTCLSLIALAVVGTRFVIGESEPASVHFFEELGDTQVVGLTSTGLAERCRSSNLPDCGALMTASCWVDVTLHVCLRTPSNEHWTSLSDEYTPPQNSVRASDTGSYLKVGDAILARDATKVGTSEGFWFGAEDLLATRTPDGSVELRTVEAKLVESIPPPPGHDSEANERFWASWTLSNDGSKLAVIFENLSPELWLYDRQEERWVLLTDDPDFVYLPHITSMGFSEDDSTIIVARMHKDDDGSKPVRRTFIVEVDVASGSALTLAEADTRQDDGVKAAVSPDGTMVALANLSGHVRVLDVATREVSDLVNMCCAIVHEPPMWSPDGRFLATDTGMVADVTPGSPPTLIGPYDLRPPDPTEANLPDVRFTTSR